LRARLAPATATEAVLTVRAVHSTVSSGVSADLPQRSARLHSTAEHAASAHARNLKQGSVKGHLARVALHFK